METQIWDLNPLYSSFSSKEFQSDFLLLQKKIEDLKIWINENLKDVKNSTKKIETYIAIENEIGTLSEKLLVFSQLKFSADTNDTTALKYLNLLEEQLTESTVPNIQFQKWLCSLKTIDFSAPVLKEHSFFLKELLSFGNYILSEQEEAILSKMKLSGSSAWSKLHDSLTSSLIVTIDKKEYPLSAVRNMAYSSDKEIRKKAYEAELDSYKKISSSCASCLNSIKAEVLTESKLRGYSSPLEMTLLHSRMDFETLYAMFEAMKESLPFFQEYLYKKAVLLNHKEKGLPFYDLFAPMGTVNMEFTFEEAKEFILKNFYSFSQKLGDYALQAFDKHWIDVYPRNAKQGGAFCSNIHSIGESRILTNFTGSFSDVITIAHELGHGYHGSCLDKNSYLNSDYPMPIAETASTFCETIVKNAALKTASKEESIFILENDISDHTQIIIDIYSRFLFEDAVFEKRKNGSLSVEEFCEIMLDAQSQTYGKGLNKKYMHPYMWICKTHYYDADYNYYNFPYAFGLLFAKGLYSQYLKNSADFISKYDLLLSATGITNLYDTAKTADINIHSSEFWKDSLSIITDDIKKFVK